MARNRQRNRPGRPAGGSRPARPILPGDGGAPPPIEDDGPAVFADDEDDGRGGEVTAFGVPAGPGGIAEAAFGQGESEAHRQPSGNILLRTGGFLRNCWAELQRVQWPDRQQVAQATGVVLGFVVITGIFLGVADFVAGKLVNWIV